jgi:cytochrome c oxidase subunit II
MTRTSIAAAIAVLGLVGTVGGWRRPPSAGAPAGAERVIHLTAKRFEYVPSEITVRKGVPVIVEITSLDRDHGFKVPELGVRADVEPGKTTRFRIVPDRVGRFAFRCDVFCGSGHEDMVGELVVVE